MGLSSKKVKTSTKPIYGSEITGAHSQLSNTYNQQAPRVGAIADRLTGMLPEMEQRWRDGNPALNAASGYVTDTLGGDATNPHLDAWIDQTQSDVSNRLGARLNKMGLSPAGTTDQALQTRELGKVALGARMDDWNAAQQRKAQAAGLAPGIAAGEAIGIAPMLSTAQLGANLPMDLATRYAAGTGGLLGQYTNSTQKQSGGFLGDLLLSAASGASSYAASMSDIRLKEDIRRIGQTDGGLPVYTFRYKGEPKVHMGVMAQEVAEAQPDALGPVLPGGYGTVYYGKVR